MKTTKWAIFLTVLLTGVAFIACNKNDSPAIPSQVLALTKQPWKITDIRVSAIDGNTDSCILKDCNSDDLISFSENGTYNFSDGNTICDSTAFYYGKGKWGYNLSEDSLYLNIQDSKYLAWKVLTINDSVLKVIYLDTIVSPIKINKTVSFKH